MGRLNLPKMSLTQHHISDDLRESFSSFEHDVVHDDLRGSFSARKQEISQHLSDDLRESFSSAPHDDLRGSFSASADVLSDDFRESLNAARSDDLRGSFATRAPCDDLCESFSASSPIDDLRESLKMEPRHRRLPFGHSTETPESRDWRKGQSVAPPQHARPKQFTAGARRPPRSRDAIARLMAKDLAHVEAGHAKKKREAHERRKKQAAAKKQPKPSPPVPAPAPDPPAAPEHTELFKEIENELWTTPQVFVCIVGHPGVGYRFTPSFADKDKNKDNRGPRCTLEDGTPIQRCAIGTEFVKSKEGVTFLKCSTGRGWLPLHTPNGTQDCFKHLGAEGEVDTSNMRFKRTLEESAAGGEKDKAATKAADKAAKKPEPLLPPSQMTPPHEDKAGTKSADKAATKSEDKGASGEGTSPSKAKAGFAVPNLQRPAKPTAKKASEGSGPGKVGGPLC